jgi:hypothetical protein
LRGKKRVYQHTRGRTNEKISKTLSLLRLIHSLSFFTAYPLCKGGGHCPLFC